MILCVRTATAPAATAFAAPVALDFSADAQQAGGSVVAYAVALSGFVANFEHHSGLYWAKKLGRIAVTLTPTLVGNIVYVTGNVVLTDYGSDTAHAPGGGTNPGSTVQITVLALIGTSLADSQFALGNAYSPSNLSVNVASNSTNWAFLAGFATQSTDGSASGPGPITLSAISTSAHGPTTLNGSIQTPDFVGTGSVDVGFLSVPPGNWKQQIRTVDSISWTQPDASGIAAMFEVEFTLNDGESIGNAALLLENVAINYDANAAFQLIEVTSSSLAIIGNLVTGVITMNIHNPDALAHHYILSGSTVSALVAAQIDTQN